MKLFHLGLHKTGTTSLQMHLFRRAGVPYHGLHGSGAWLDERAPWFRYFAGLQDAPPPLPPSFVFSDESALLRAGGIDGVAAMARRLARDVPGATVLVTVREPASLLVSAYYQSLRLRATSFGYAQGRARVQDSARFLAFEAWWSRLREDRGTSLAGLLDYRTLQARLAGSLGEDAVVLLPLESLRGDRAGYAAVLRGLGFPADAVDAFLATPAENRGDAKFLRRMQPLAWRLGHGLQGGGAYPAARRVVHGLRLTRALEKLIYSAPPGGLGAPDPALLDAIAAEFAPGWQDVMAAHEQRARTWDAAGTQGTGDA